MEFKINISFQVDSQDVLQEELQFEYYRGKKGKISTDTISITDREITITGNRSRPIDIVECWKTKRSNYKRCILSSMFYVYNFYMKPVEITSMTITVGDKTKEIDYSEEFNVSLLKDYQISEQQIKKLFKTISYRSFSNVLLNVLYSQVVYSNNHDFYYAYRSFNSIYTYIYTYYKEFQKSASNRDVKKDIDAITHILRCDDIISKTQKSIKLSTELITDKSDEMSRLLLSWIKNEKMRPETFKKKVGYEDFVYENYNVLEIIKRVKEECFPGEVCKLKSFDSRYRQKKMTDSTLKNCLQLIIIYANYYRNKILHGEYMDPNFLISDVNIEMLKPISDIVFQLSIDLVNQWEAENFGD